MAVLGQNYACTMEGWQSEQRADGGKVYFKVYPNQHPGMSECDFVGRYTTPQPWYIDENGNATKLYEALAIPAVFGSKAYRSGGSYYVRATGHQYAYEFYTYDDWKTADVFEFERSVYINRGNARQASKTVSFKLANRGNWYNDMVGTVTIYTSRVADVSNINFTTTADGKTVQNRHVHINASYTNPENYYTGRITGPGIDETFNGSISRNISIPRSWYNTTQRWILTIKGKDNTTYYTQPIDVYIEPSGVGVWYRNSSGAVKEVSKVYYRNSSGTIKDVTELWYRKNGNQIVRTTK